MRLSKKDVGKLVLMTWTDAKPEVCVYLDHIVQDRMICSKLFMIKDGSICHIDSWSQIRAVGKYAFDMKAIKRLEKKLPTTFRLPDRRPSKGWA